MSVAEPLGFEQYLGSLAPLRAVIPDPNAGAEVIHQAARAVVELPEISVDSLTSLIEEHPEWVLLLAGSASLIFEGKTEPLVLEPGSYVHIEAHVRHRVAWTDPSVPTVWLAIHYQ